MTDDIDIDTERAIADAATPGWSHDGSSHYVETPQCGRAQRFVVHRVEDAAFIARARTLVPRLLDALEQARKEQDALRRDGRALVEQFENISHALNDIGWPSENKLGTERACDALRSLAIDRESLNQQLDALRQQLEAVTRERDEAVQRTEAGIATWLENHASACSESVRAKSRLGTFGTSAEAKQSIHNAEQREIGMLQAADDIRAGSWRAKEGK